MPELTHPSHSIYLCTDKRSKLHADAREVPFNCAIHRSCSSKGGVDDGVFHANVLDGGRQLPSFVGRGPVHHGYRDVHKSQVDAKLRAMVHQVVEHA
jgi:hypothetical protein